MKTMCNVLTMGKDGSPRRGSSFELDVAVEGRLELEARNLQRHPCRERLLAGDRAGRDRLGHRLLDLALRVDADQLEEFPDAEVESFFVHRELLWIPGGPWPDADCRVGRGGS